MARTGADGTFRMTMLEALRPSMDCRVVVSAALPHSIETVNQAFSETFQYHESETSQHTLQLFNCGAQANEAFGQMSTLVKDKLRGTVRILFCTKSRQGFTADCTVTPLANTATSEVAYMLLELTDLRPSPLGFLNEVTPPRLQLIKGEPNAAPESRVSPKPAGRTSNRSPRTASPRAGGRSSPAIQAEAAAISACVRRQAAGAASAAAAAAAAAAVAWAAATGAQKGAAGAAGAAAAAAAVMAAAAVAATAAATTEAQQSAVETAHFFAWLAQGRHVPTLAPLGPAPSGATLAMTSMAAAMAANAAMAAPDARAAPLATAAFMGASALPPQVMAAPTPIAIAMAAAAAGGPAAGAAAGEAEQGSAAGNGAKPPAHRSRVTDPATRLARSREKNRTNAKKVRSAKKRKFEALIEENRLLKVAMEDICDSVQNLKPEKIEEVKVKCRGALDRLKEASESALCVESDEMMDARDKLSTTLTGSSSSNSTESNSSCLPESTSDTSYTSSANSNSNSKREVDGESGSSQASSCEPQSGSDSGSASPGGTEGGTASMGDGPTGMELQNPAAELQKKHRQQAATAKKPADGGRHEQ
jgi:hypothetical protein